MTGAASMTTWGRQRSNALLTQGTDKVSQLVSKMSRDRRERLISRR